MSESENGKLKEDSQLLVERLESLSLRSASPAAAPEQPASGGPSDLLADPIALMREHRELNAGHLVDAPESRASREAKASLQSGFANGNLVASFPAELAPLFTLEKLDETALRELQDVWALITSRPQTTAELIRREVGLIALNWAQECLVARRPLLTNAEWSLLEDERERANRNIVLFELTRPRRQEGGKQEANGFLRKGAAVRLAVAGSLESPEKVPSARVVDTNGRTIVVEFVLCPTKGSCTVGELVDAFEATERVDVYPASWDFVVKATLTAVDRLKEGVCDHILDPAPFFKQNKRDFEDKLAVLQPTLSAYTGVNEQQAGALYAICTRAHADAPFVLHGPPGTGKTRVIAATARCLLEMDADARILLAAPSNMAADMLALKLMENFAPPVMTAAKVFRLRSAANDFASRERRLDSISCFNSAETTFEIPDADFLHKKRVIVCTLGCSAHLVKALEVGHFSHIFLDEAGQATEGTIWLPIGGLATRRTSVVLCGDDRQLGPVWALDLSKQLTDGFDSPLLRYSNLSLYKTDKRVLGQLQRSYRCHPSILSVASQLFYSSRLLNGTDGRAEPFLEWAGLPNKQFPLLVVSVDGREHRKNDSYGNEAEVAVVLDYLRRLTRDFPQLQPEDIGVISPYRHRSTQLINAALMNSDIRGKKRIAVDSVERFQGSERKVIFLTTVRTGSLGFLACDKRLNTSITRAMNLLLVVGNTAALSRNPSRKRFVDYATENKALIKRKNAKPPPSDFSAWSTARMANAGRGRV